MERIVNAMEYTDRGMKKCIRELKNQYDFLETFSIGQSCMGREIPALKIGQGEYCLFTAGFSGTERSQTNILLMFAEELCKCIKEGIPFAGINVNKVFNGRGIIIVPRVNIDGTEIALCGAAAAGAYAKEIRRMAGDETGKWCANLRGVEISRNFSVGWNSIKETQRALGIFAPRACGYSGPFAESEPETAAVISLCEKMKFRHSISFYNGDSVIYWQYGDKLSGKSEKMANIMAQYSGYSLEPLQNTSPTANLKDWFADTFGRPAFNVYINADNIHTCNEVYNDIRKMLLISSML